MPLSRSASRSDTPCPTSSMVRRVPYEPPSSCSSRVGVHSADFITRLSAPPPTPRPKIRALAPFSASTRSTLYRSRKYCTSSRIPSTKKPAVVLLPRIVA